MSMPYAIILFGAILLLNGLVIIKNRKYTEDEGLRVLGSGFKGKFAIAIGYCMTAVAVIILIVGLIVLSYNVQ